MKFHLVILIIISLTCLIFAQDRIEVTLLGGYLWGGEYSISSGRIKIDNSASVGFTIDIPVKETPGLMAKVTYSQANSALSYQEQIFSPMMKLFDMTVHYFQAGGLYVEKKGKFSPFGAVTVGAALFDPVENNYTSEWVFTASLGFGVKYFITDHWGMRIQGRLIAPVQLEEGSLWCQSGNGCVITLKSGTVLLQADMLVGMTYRF